MQSSRNRRTRILVLLTVLILPQFILIGPSLFGGKILLPLDILQQPQAYLPIDPAHPPGTPHDRLTSDLVYLFEPHRQFIVSEIRAGRLPLWNPYNYCGVPCLAAGQGAVFSPLRVLDYLWTNPAVIGWDRVLRAIVMGTGAYLFFRRVLGVGFAPAAIGAWCYPLTGFMTIWDGYTLPMVALWLPWILLSIEETIRAPRSAWPIVLAVTTASMIFSGHPAMSLHVIMVAAIFALWRVIARGGWRAPITAALAILCGILLACPQIFPSAEYLNHSYRVAQRRAGVREQSSEGPQALLQMVLPYYYGSDLGDSLYVIPDRNRPESGAAGYAGLIVALVLAPLGWLNRRLRSFQIFWLVLAFFAVAEIIRFPLIGWLMDHPPFSVARGNRLVFASAFAILASAVAGLEELFSDRSLRRVWLWGICGLLLVLCIVSSDRATNPAAQLEPLHAEAQTELEKVGAWSARKTQIEALLTAALPSLGANHVTGAIVSGGAMILLTLVQIDFLSPLRRRGVILASAAIVELLVMAWNLNAQCDASLYYPNLPVFDEVRNAPAVRAIGVGALPANLNLTQRLYDIRGFDGADPQDYDEILQHITIGNSSPPYAPTQLMIPANGPLFDSLGVRYLFFRGSPPTNLKPAWVGNDYWILENRGAAPRAFVPKSVRTLNDDKAQLDELFRPDFDPTHAFVELPKGLEMNNCEGTVHITAENPERVELSAYLKTEGFVLLTDRWDSGWQATVNGKSEVVYRANRLFRAVQVPAGASTIVFTYAPLSFTIGCWCALTGIAAIVWWGLHSRRQVRSRSSDFV